MTLRADSSVNLAASPHGDLEEQSHTIGLRSNAEHLAEHLAERSWGIRW